MPQSLCTHSQLVLVQNEEFELLCERAIYWKKKKTLLIADLHIGKVTHFRNNNIPIPHQAAEKNFRILEHLFLKYQPKTVYFLGDLFHSYYNKEWDRLSFLLAKYPKIKFELVTGNHDILKDEHYVLAGISCVSEKVVGPFKLTHHPEEDSSYYNLCGHIHPGVKMRGSGRQYVKLPCFYFGKNQGILPAFGNFTGTAPVKIQEGDRIFACIKDQVLSIV
ncbi:ligase-associated DNA damage response endonuclease PdeM [Portibacter marinus]|uniref:ligase-associated DNA damage response endonuclease PdeM n=1 Tax=Portibacter marinus TaxID=2898660 RepID=UPI001F16199E|nr:ligase-associated DNA damage response endonuclease PdeM [Portibacter marinus]